MLFFSLLMLCFLISPGLFSIFLSFSGLFLMSKMSLPSSGGASPMSKFMSYEEMSGWLLALTLISLIGCSLATYSMKQTSSLEIHFFLILISVVSSLFFLSTWWVKFYIYFELTLIPILIVILGWGYQTERIKASKALMLYTISGSLPLLLVLAWSINQGAVQLSQVSSSVTPHLTQQALMLLCSLAFLVKLPLFLTHMWLPKAHVEAPVVGSMYLAAVLLKLGGFGLMKLAPLFSSPSLLPLVLAAINLWGALYISGLCVLSLDVKVLIAFSSVAHMGMGLTASLMSSSFGKLAFLMVLVSHGISSAMMFYQSFLVYSKTNTRSVLISKSKELSLGLWSLTWAISVLGMMGAPPTFNLWVEISALLAIIPLFSLSLKFLFWILLLAGVYSFILMAAVYSGQVLFFTTKTSSIYNVEKSVLGLFSGFLLIFIGALPSISY